MQGVLASETEVFILRGTDNGKQKDQNITDPYFWFTAHLIDHNLNGRP